MYKRMQSYARYAVRLAIRDGRLEPATEHTCQQCGSTPACVYHHHDGYNIESWLKVTPLCIRCHSLSHPPPPPPKRGRSTLFASKQVGVYYVKSTNKWHAQRYSTTTKKSSYIGRYSTEEEAVRAVRQANT